MVTGRLLLLLLPRLQPKGILMQLVFGTTVAIFVFGRWCYQHPFVWQALVIRSFSCEQSYFKERKNDVSHQNLKCRTTAIRYPVGDPQSHLSSEQMGGSSVPCS